uniref:Secreted protein n=1 Tax=Arundo donax TaxID=35708 RepID=A0A0A9G3E8_ARUDO
MLSRVAVIGLIFLAHGLDPAKGHASCLGSRGMGRTTHYLCTGPQRTKLLCTCGLTVRENRELTERKGLRAPLLPSAIAEPTELEPTAQQRARGTGKRGKRILRPLRTRLWCLLSSQMSNGGR